jgi:hypothetical protein
MPNGSVCGLKKAMRRLTIDKIKNIIVKRRPGKIGKFWRSMDSTEINPSG